MKKMLLCFGLLVPAAVLGQYVAKTLDIQSTPEVSISQFPSGNTLSLKFTLKDAGSAYEPGAGWGARFFYSRDVNAVDGGYWVDGSLSSNVVTVTSTNPIPSQGTWYWSLIGTNSSGAVRTWGRGTMNAPYDPAADDTTLALSPVRTLNFDRYVESGTLSNVTIIGTIDGLSTQITAEVASYLTENPPAGDGTNDLIATEADVVAAVGGTTVVWTSAPLTDLHFTIESELVTTITNVGTEVATSLVGDVTWVEVATNPIRQVRRWVQVPYRGSLSGRTNTQSAAPSSVATYDAATGLSTQLTAGAWGLTNVVTGGGETVTRWATYDWPANYALGGDAYILALPGGTLASQALVDVDAAIAGAGSAIDLLSTWGVASASTSGSHYVWATNLFFDAKRFAFQSVGDARSPGATGYNYGPLVLISSNAALTVLHSSSGGWVGDWVTFADTNGVSRLTYYQSLTDVGQDVGLVKLDPPLPPSVPVARLVDDADGAKLGSTTGTFGTPLLYYDGNLHLYLARLWRTYESSFYGFVVEPFDQAARAAKYAVLDHGGAFLVPTDDAMIVVGMHYTTTAARDWLPGMWTAISNACVTAGAAVPTVYSLGSYNDR